MCTVAVRSPLADGLKVTVKVVESLPKMVAGSVMPPTVKSAALAPSIVMPPAGMFSGARSVLRMVKVWTAVCTVVLLSTATLPKSVSSPTVGVVSPSTMVVLLPCTSISGTVPVPCRLQVNGVPIGTRSEV